MYQLREATGSARERFSRKAAMTRSSNFKLSRIHWSWSDLGLSAPRTVYNTARAFRSFGPGNSNAIHTMAGHSTINTYSIPAESQRLLQDGIIKNKLQKNLPPETETCAANVRYEGSRLPSIAVNWRLAESMAALKGFEATMINVLIGRKYNSPPLPIVINTYVQPKDFPSLPMTLAYGVQRSRSTAVYELPTTFYPTKSRVRGESDTGSRA